eukprot:scaffold6581_cov57-Attheya_sp.AAC.2
MVFPVACAVAQIARDITTQRTMVDGHRLELSDIRHILPVSSGARRQRTGEHPQVQDIAKAVGSQIKSALRNLTLRDDTTRT